jgi:hypothetical protein
LVASILKFEVEFLDRDFLTTFVNSKRSRTGPFPNGVVPFEFSNWFLLNAKHSECPKRFEDQPWYPEWKGTIDRAVTARTELTRKLYGTKNPGQGDGPGLRGIRVLKRWPPDRD